MPNESNKSKKLNYQDPKLIDRWANMLSLVGRKLSDDQLRQKIRELLPPPAAQPAQTKGQ